MSDALHPVAPHHLPPFITAPGETDVLLVATGIFLLIAVVSIGLVYFKLHALPEQLAHRGQKVQFQLVAVLGLLALFTHNHAFWIAGLLLALVPLPDFTTPLSSIATSLERIAGGTGPVASPTAPTTTPGSPPAPLAQSEPPQAPPPPIASLTDGSAPTGTAAPAQPKGGDHA